VDQAIDEKPELAAADLSACYRCGRRLTRGWGFFLRTSPTLARQEIGFRAGEIAKCLLCAVRHPPMLRRSLRVAAVVGTILTLLNQGDIILAGEWETALYWKIPLTYCVPFFVATFGALANGRR
jgi:hypothetical protein